MSNVSPIKIASGLVALAAGVLAYLVTQSGNPALGITPQLLGWIGVALFVLHGVQTMLPQIFGADAAPPMLPLAGVSPVTVHVNTAPGSGATAVANPPAAGELAQASVGPADQTAAGG